MTSWESEARDERALHDAGYRVAGGMRGEFLWRHIDGGDLLRQSRALELLEAAEEAEE